MVSEKVITKLGVEPPSHQMVDSYMAIIAENYNVPYERDPTAALVSNTVGRHIFEGIKFQGLPEICLKLKFCGQIFEDN